VTAKDTKNRTIVLPIGKGTYERFLIDNELAHEIIQELYESHSELFPRKVSLSYKLNRKPALLS
jgi:hypothetical protein